MALWTHDCPVRGRITIGGIVCGRCGAHAPEVIENISTLKDERDELRDAMAGNLLPSEERAQYEATIQEWMDRAQRAEKRIADIKAEVERQLTRHRNIAKRNSKASARYRLTRVRIRDFESLLHWIHQREGEKR